MKKLIINLLGLNTLVNQVDLLRKENEELKKSLKELKEEVNEIEIPDMDDYVAHCDLDDNIDSYLNNNDYATQNWVQGEIEDIDVSEQVESAIEDYDIEEKIRDLFNDASPAPMSEDDIKKEVANAVKVTLEKMVKAMADQQD